MLRLYEIAGDAMEPTLRGGDFLMVAPCSRYQYETTYLFDFGHGESPYLASPRPGGVYAIWHPNRLYGIHEITRAEFNAAVRAIVVAEISVKDRHIVQRAGLLGAQRSLEAA